MARRLKATIQQANEAARVALAAQSRGDAHGVGALGYWDVDASGWRETASTVRDACLAAGLDPASTLPLPPDYVAAFGRAVDAVRARVRDAGYTLTDAAQGPNGERRVAVARIERNGVVSFDPNQSIVACPRDGTAPYVEHDTGTTTAAGDVVALAKNTYHDHYTSDDLVRTITGLLGRWACLPCRRQAPHVVYWIPDAALPTIERLSDFVKAIGWGSIDLFIGDPSKSRTVDAVTNTVNKGLEERLNEFADNADKYTSSAKTRAGTLESMLDEAENLRKQWALYRAVLGSAVKSGDGRLEKIESAIRTRLETQTAAAS
jgi:hypothetical protein